MDKGAPQQLKGRIISGSRQLEHGNLLQRAGRAAAGFEALGVGEGDSVALFLRNDFALFEASIGANLLSAHAVPINWHFQAAETRYILEDCGAGVLVVHADLLPRIRDGVPAEVVTLVVPTPEEVRQAYCVSPEATRIPAGTDSWEEWMDAQVPRPLAEPPPLSSMIYTSGTTGHPKGVRRDSPTEEQTARIREKVAQIFGFGLNDDFRTVVTGPMYHSAPNAYGLYAAKTGGLCVLEPRFDPETLLRCIEEYRITHLHMVPTMFVRLLKLPPEVRSRYDLSSLEFVVHAAAPCPPEVKTRMIEWWGPVINEYYGSTETGAVAFHTSDEALRKPGTVGRPTEDSVVRVYDEAGKVLGPGEVGEIYARTWGMPDFTYHKRDDRRREVERDGLVTVGDVGYLDEDGYLFLCDRKTDMVISGGVNIYPAEIENVLVAMPGVLDCAVFGVPDPEFGESLCACIEAEPGATLSEAQVKDYLVGRVAGYKVPKRVELRRDLPREDSGKIFKRRLRDEYWQGSGRRI